MAWRSVCLGLQALCAVIKVHSHMRGGTPLMNSLYLICNANFACGSVGLIQQCDKLL